jgi:hypothetical protein
MNFPPLPTGTSPRPVNPSLRLVLDPFSLANPLALTRHTLPALTGFMAMPSQLPITIFKPAC